MKTEKRVRNDMQSIGLKMRELRQAKHMTQNEIADLVGCTVNTISRAELGANHINAVLLIRVAEVLGAELNDFMPSHIKEARFKGDSLRDLSDMEISLIGSFRKMSDKEKSYFVNVIEIYVNMQSD